jgi:hypothetical protein
MSLSISGTTDYETITYYTLQREGCIYSVVEGLHSMASLLFATIQIKAMIAAKCIALVFAQNTAQGVKWNFKTERINRGREQCYFHLWEGSQGTGSFVPLGCCWQLSTGTHQRHLESISWNWQPLFCGLWALVCRDLLSLGFQLLAQKLLPQ